MEIKISVPVNNKKDLENFIESCSNQGFDVTREGGGKLPNFSGFYAELKGTQWQNNTKQSYGKALEALKNGKRVSREGWNSKGMFVFQRPGDTLDKDFIPKVKSLPQNVKSFLHQQDRDIEFLPYLCMYDATGKIVNGWLASQTDMLSEDWCILD